MGESHQRWSQAMEASEWEESRGRRGESKLHGQKEGKERKGRGQRRGRGTIGGHRQGKG